VEPWPTDLASLVGEWRLALASAQGALQAASHDLAPSELRLRSSRLAEERNATVRLLEAIARDRGEERALVRLVGSTWDARRLLGLPAGITACVFSADGVLVPSAATHAEAWEETFDALLASRIERSGTSFAPFSFQLDYEPLVHGRTRQDAIRAFLASRGTALPEGSPDDPPGVDTVNALASLKSAALRRRLEARGVKAYQGTRLFLELAHEGGIRCAVVSGSTTLPFLLERAGLADLVDERVDGETVRAEHLRRKPAPDMLLEAGRRLGAAPDCTAVFETSVDGVVAGRDGGFDVVVAVDHGGQRGALRARGADLVVSDLGEILAHSLDAGTDAAASRRSNA
jgi:HAD superfamily hydrolase (TIGR01509 family)